MEKFLERYLQLRTRYFLDPNTSSSQPGTLCHHPRLAVDASFTTNPKENQNMTSIILRKGIELLWIVNEWCLAWMLIVIFSLWYLWEYYVLSMTCKICESDTSIYNIPATSIPQTELNQSSKYWDDCWDEFQKLVVVNGNVLDVYHLVQLLRSNLRARQLASLLLVKKGGTLTSGNRQFTTIQSKILFQLRHIWSRVLRFPTNENQSRSYTFRISLIIPAYNELTNQLQTLLRHTLETCHDPSQVQVIVVHAGHGEQWDSNSLLDLSPSSKSFGILQVVDYSGTGGRGGAMNFGTIHAQGSIYTFLHADTLLPTHWDQSIQQALLPSNDDHDNSVSTQSPPTITTMCAFAMGVDTSTYKKGFPWSSKYYPAGLWGADRILGYTRCTLCRLPYGDSVLSIPARIMDYLGGYPDQPLMEDYELVQLLRHRASLVSTQRERIVILNDRIACSPRRWHQYGVPYVILSNAYCIYRYTRLKESSEELFSFYYRQSVAAQKKKL